MKIRFVPYFVVLIFSFISCFIYEHLMSVNTQQNHTVLQESFNLASGVEFANSIWSKEDFLQLAYEDSLVKDLPYILRADLENYLYDEEGSLDHWGNPYHIIHENRKGVSWIGLYSCGKDGLSASSGDDKDDINSWNIKNNDYYRKKISIEKRRNFIKNTILKGFVLFFILIFLCKIYK